MAKISSYPDSSTPQDADQFVIARAGSNFSTLWSSIKTAIKTYLDAFYGSILTYNNTTVTTANVSAAANNVYNCTIAGLTANRNFVLPAPSAAGKIIRVNILDGDATYALILIGDAGVTINSGSAATEWSRLFIKGESVTFESTSTANWKVITDGRIPCNGKGSRDAAQSINSGSNTKVLIDAAEVNVGGIVDFTTNNRIDIRRSGNYMVAAGVLFAAVIDDGEYASVSVQKSAAQISADISYSSVANGQPSAQTGPQPFALAVGDYLELYVKHNEGAAQNTLVPPNAPWISVTEVLQ